MLCSLGQHRTLEAIRSSLPPTETLVVVTPRPDPVGVICGSLQKNPWVHSSIQDRAEVSHCEVVDRVAQAAKLEAKVSEVPKCHPTSNG